VRDEAVSTYDTAFVRTSRVFEDLCRLAGKDKIADRIRPSTSRPGHTEENPPDADAESGLPTVTV
jgi:hypothetical protein